VRADHTAGGQARPGPLVGMDINISHRPAVLSIVFQLLT